MKKNYFFLLLFTSIALAANSQEREGPPIGLKEAKVKPAVPWLSLEVNKNKAPQALQRSKTIGTVLYSEDFDSTGTGGLPAGWQVITNTGGAALWRWSNSAPGGQYSTAISPINSSTGSNGFLSAPMDLLNSPFPPSGATGFDDYVQSPALSIAPVGSVLLEWEQSIRYCCSSTNEIVVEVSTDAITWHSYDANYGRSPATAVPNPPSAPAELAQVNVSAHLANQSTVYVRFRVTGASHYYWMIDDFKIIEGATDAIAIEEYNINFSDTLYNPVMAIVPQLALNPLTFGAIISNGGSNAQSGVGLEIEMVHDSSYGGASGMGVVSLQSSTLAVPLLPFQSDTLRVGPYINTVDGYMRAIFRGFIPGTNQTPQNAIAEHYFVVSDSILGKDLGPYLGGAGPGNFVGGGNDGDRWGSLLTVGNNPKLSSGITCNSISIRVSNSALNDGVSIQPRIWDFADTASSFANLIPSPPIGSSPIATVVDTSMFNQWITLPLFPPATIIPGKQYVVGWEQMSGAATGLEFSASRDRNVEPFQEGVTNFLYVNDANPGWGWVTQVAAVRMNLALSIGIEEKESASVFTLSPNPNDGNFAINISSNSPKTYQLNVRNMLGQTVYTENVSVNGSKKQELSLAGMERGVYFVSLSNGEKRLVKKVIVH